LEVTDPTTTIASSTVMMIMTATNTVTETHTVAGTTTYVATDATTPAATGVATMTASAMIINEKTTMTASAMTSPADTIMTVLAMTTSGERILLKSAFFWIFVVATLFFLKKWWSIYNLKKCQSRNLIPVHMQGPIHKHKEASDRALMITQRQSNQVSILILIALGLLALGSYAGYSHFSSTSMDTVTVAHDGTF
jgi:hypothetical protein